MIEYDFQVPRYIYVDLYFVADIVKMEDANSFDTILDAHFSVVTEMIQQLFSVTDEQYKDNNVVADSGTIYTTKLAVGEKFENETDTIYVLETGNYRLELLDCN